MNSKKIVIEATIKELHEAIQSGNITVTSIIEEYIDRIERFDRGGPEINSIITLNHQARKRAQQLDTTFQKSGFVGPLHGIPVLVKDQMMTKNITTTFGSEAFSSYIPNRNATIIQRIRDAGGIILGKTNLPDWAAGFVGYSSANGQTKNPYALNRDPGGSSAGTGAGVAANFGTIGIGEDTGGSIRVPASCCNLYGLRPTTGLISRSGLSPLVKRQDTPGPMGRSVEDVARLLEVLVGFDIKDERTGGTTMNKDSKSYVDQIDKIELKNTRIGILRSVFGEDSNPNVTPVNKVISETLSVISAEGAELIDPVSISGLSHKLKRSSLHDIIPKYNINNFLSELEDSPVRSIKELHQSGAYHDALELFETIAKAPDDPTNDFEFWRSVATQESLREQLLYLFAKENLDAIAFPSIQILPPKYEDLHNKKITRDDHPVNTIIASQASCPSISIPAGMTDNNIPIGMELLGKPYHEANLLSLAHSFEKASDTRKRPQSTISG